MSKYAPEARRSALLFIGGAVALGASIAAERELVQQSDDTTKAERAYARSLRQHLDPTGELLDFGQTYLATSALRPTLGELVRELVENASRDRVDVPPEAVLSRLARRIEEDFASGRITTISGWLLSRTEARLCALTALA